jgi:PIN domain nuclease of toxin-antitoxin system
VRLLVDTHALVWWWQADRRLPRNAEATISDPDHDIVVSSVTAWEMAIRFRLGKWPEVGQIIAGFDGLLADSGFGRLPLCVSHALLAGNLPGPRRDPFHRLLAGQALVEAMTVITGDAGFRALGVPTLWEAERP